MRRPVRPYQWVALAAITAAAAALRLILIGKVAPDPFYDAAVRSMGLSWHNFFFGAFEPGASVSIDKPPVDLWLQVVSVKVFGFSATTLKLPEAFAGIAAVPLLFLVVRRMWSTTAGLAAAASLAVLPVDVITSRSDTMDGVMMTLIVLALLLILRACDTGRWRWLLAGAAVMGLAFDVKILESMVALPALAVIALLGFPAARGRRVLALAAAGAVYVVVALAWLTATLFVPAHDRPWAIGATNGSAWNAVFVFNGTDRLGGKSPEPQFTVYEPGHKYPVATQSQRDHIPIVPPSPTRLLARIGPLSGERLGMELLAALLLGIPALLWGLIRRRATAGGDEDEDRDEDDEAQRRLGLAVAAGLGLWLLTGIVLFSHMARLHPRYVEGLVPAVAATLGIGVAWASEARGRARLIVLAVSLAIVVFYGERLLFGTSSEWWISLAGALGALALATLARWPAVPASLRTLAAPSGVLVLTLCAVLAIPVGTDITAIDDHVTDAGEVGVLPGEVLQPLSSYLRAHQGSARYEVAAQSATQIGALIVRDARPIVILTSYDAGVFTTIDKLKHLIAAGEVRYAFLNSPCPHPTSPTAAKNPACSAPAQWIRAHGTDVSHKAGLPHGKVLWLLPGVKP
jgi:4-amino-4-deoxy-L-arabinose transferase-like glycosyltransferase